MRVNDEIAAEVRKIEVSIVMRQRRVCLSNRESAPTEDPTLPRYGTDPLWIIDEAAKVLLINDRYSLTSFVLAWKF